MIAMTIMAVLGMFSSFVISEIADKDAAAINISGSLRKQSYLMLSELLAQDQNHTADVKLVSSLPLDMFDNFEDILLDPVLVHGFSEEDDSRLSYVYTDVVNNWNTVAKPALAQFNPGVDNERLLVNVITDFVDKIDLLVYQYQQEAEGKIELLRIIQLVALFGTLLLVYVAMTSIHGHIEKPLTQLTELAKRIRDGDLTSRVDIENKDELGILAEAFNSMSDSLSASHADLEMRVNDKTKELKRSNDSLKLLFDTSRTINEVSEEETNFQPILDRLSALTDVENMDLCLSQPDIAIPYVHIMTVEDLSIRTNCDDKHCDECVGESCFTTGDAKNYQVKFPLVLDETNYGVLVVRFNYDQGLEIWQHRLIQGVADQIAIALSLKNQVYQDRRVALLNERTVIARELHDSLAQSLSYLKIQVTRLQKAHNKGADEDVFQSLIVELKDGLSSAYRQLRELLATFRLKIDGRGLKGALIDAIAQLQSRTDMDIELNYQVDSIPFTPNEEIHILQVTKEALQNALHHSRGSQVSVNLLREENLVKVSVVDNGIGIPDDPEKMNHYGLVIMKERSNILAGDFSIKRGETNGTEVNLIFSPVSITPAKLVIS